MEAPSSHLRRGDPRRAGEGAAHDPAASSADDLVRGQFRGYRDEPGVAPDSYMATYAALRLHVDSWRWEGVPFFVRAGKSLALTVHRGDGRAARTRRRSSSRSRRRRSATTCASASSPQVAIALGARAKQPGEGMIGQPVELSVVEQREQGRRAGWTPTSACSATR